MVISLCLGTLGVRQVLARRKADEVPPLDSTQAEPRSDALEAGQFPPFGSAQAEPRPETPKETEQDDLMTISTQAEPHPEVPEAEHDDVISICMEDTEQDEVIAV